MRDVRVEKLAKNLINYSVHLQPGERVLIEATGIPADFVCCLVEQAYQAGGIPLVNILDNQVLRTLKMHCNEEQLELMAKYDSLRMRDCQAYIGVRGGENAFEGADVPPAKNELWGVQYSNKVHGQIRVPQTKWVVLRYPTPGMAQQAQMSTDAFEAFYFDVCNMDYGKMSTAMDALVKRLERADQVHITGQGTDLTFSIKGQKAIKCAGELNIPDGEVFTAPLRESVQGHVTYTAPSLYQGTKFENVCLTFQNGKIIKEEGNYPQLLKKIFDTDEGARYVGEFSFGVNPYIHRAMLDTLFDEKIAGSFHFTPGRCYDECPNGNQSAIHWDLVCIQTPEFGGGEISLDGELIRKDGRFVTPELDCLNEEKLR